MPMDTRGRASSGGSIPTARSTAAGRTPAMARWGCSPWGDETAAIVPLVFFMFGQVEIALALAALLQLLRPVISVAVGRWRSRYGGQVRAWLETIAEFEALTSLSAYWYEHPDDPFPEIVLSDGFVESRALFDGLQLG